MPRRVDDKLSEKYLKYILHSLQLLLISCLQTFFFSENTFREEKFRISFISIWLKGNHVKENWFTINNNIDSDFRFLYSLCLLYIFYIAFQKLLKIIANIFNIKNKRMIYRFESLKYLLFCVESNFIFIYF